MYSQRLSGIVRNPNTPSDTLIEPVDDQIVFNTEIRRFVAQNPNALPEVLKLLTNEIYAADIRLTLTSPPHLAPLQRQRILEHTFTDAVNSLHLYRSSDCAVATVM